MLSLASSAEARIFRMIIERKLMALLDVGGGGEMGELSFYTMGGNVCWGIDGEDK